MFRDAGVTLDSSLSFSQHVMNTCRSAFLELRHIGLIRKYLTGDVAKTIVCSLVLSKLDYCNRILQGLSTCRLKKWQKVQNDVARITVRMPKTEHTTPLLRMLHWLPISNSIAYKIDSICHTSFTTSMFLCPCCLIFVVVQFKFHVKHFELFKTKHYIKYPLLLLYKYIIQIYNTILLATK